MPKGTRNESRFEMISPECLESVQQLTSMWRVIVQDYGERHATEDVRDLPGMAIRWADSNFGFWNCITFTWPNTSTEALRAHLRKAADYMRRKRERGLIWLFVELLTQEARAALPDLARRAGLTMTMPLYGMAGTVMPMPEPSHPELRFVRVTTEEALTGYAHINLCAYGYTLAAARE